MSRRSRRRAGRVKTSWIGRALVGLLVLALVGFLTLFLGIRGYLHGEPFRKLLSSLAGKALGGEGEFSSFRWHGLQVRTDAFEAVSGGPLRKIRADGIETEVGLGGLPRGVWELKGSHLRMLEAEIDLTEKQGSVPAMLPGANPPVQRRKEDGWLPEQAEIQDAEIGNIIVHARTPWGPAEWAGTRLRAVSEGPMNYKGTLDGGIVQTPFSWLPAIKLRKAGARWQDKTLFLTSLDAELWDGKTILNANGEWDASTGLGGFTGSVNGIPSKELLNETWAQRVNGELDLDFDCGLAPGSTQARGEARLNNGVLTALPVLDALAAYADTRRFRVIPLNEARTDWLWKNGTLHLSKLVLASEGLIRLEGGLTLKGRDLDGTFRLGLPPGTLSRIPGAETVVFTPGERGLLWTPIRVTGTLDQPREDLTDRLIAAAGARMFELLPETGEKVIRFSRTLAEDAAPKVIGEGTKVLEQGQEIIEGAGGILNGLLGNPSKENRK